MGDGKKNGGEGGGKALAPVGLGGGGGAAQVRGNLGLAVIPWTVTRDRLQYF